MNIYDWQTKIADALSYSEDLAEELWAWQYEHNPILRMYTEKIGWNQQTYLPISFFKYYPIQTTEWMPEAIFESSGTSGQTVSKHYISSLTWYKKMSIRGFHHLFPKKNYKILALLPSYIERGNASLIRMVADWIEDFGSPQSGFFLHDFKALQQAILSTPSDTPILLIGVAYALLDFSEQFPTKLPPDTIVMETGGMKGRKKELVREELHARLRAAFQLPHIYSEYGMTELMSQAYLLPDGRFYAPPWLKIAISDVHLSHIIQKTGITGRINIIDFANIHSCAFIATDDLGRQYEDGSFEVLGRIDMVEQRGCSLMYS